MTEYFHRKGLSTEVLTYLSSEQDFLITKKLSGDDGAMTKHLDQPEMLCDVFSENLRKLHEVNIIDCPKTNLSKKFFEKANKITESNKYDNDLLEYIGVRSFHEAQDLMHKLILKSVDDVLIHGDYCLPNIILDQFKFSGFIDLGLAGIGDRHYDLFWGIWTLQFNLKTDKFKDRFLDGYGRDKIDSDLLKLNGILSAFTM